MSLQVRILACLEKRAMKRSLLAALLPDVCSEELDAAIWALRRTGKIVLRMGHFELATRAVSAPQLLLGEPLTSREMTVAAIAAEGGTGKEMAAKLGMLVHTLKGHLASIYAKRGVRGKGELMQREAIDVAGRGA